MELFQTVVATFTLVVLFGLAGVIVLLAHPKTRPKLLEWIGWTGVITNSSLIVSPIDLNPIPDFVIGPGNIDEIFYLLFAYGFYQLAQWQRQKRTEISSLSTQQNSAVFCYFLTFQK